jgi:hypothetical protein
VITSSQRPLPDNTQHAQQTSTPLVGFETTISAGKRLQTYALDLAATGTGLKRQLLWKMIKNLLTQSIVLLKENKWD